MGALVRVLLYCLAGYLAGAGWINEELRNYIVSDPDLSDILQVALAALLHGLVMIWWRVAHWKGWPL